METNLTFQKALHRLTSTSFTLLNNFKDLAKSEANLAKQSLFSLLAIFLFVIVLAGIAWLGVLGIFLAILRAYHYSWIEALCMASLVNIVFIGFFILKIQMLKANLYFPHTRQQLANLFSNTTDPSHVQTEK